MNWHNFEIAVIRSARKKTMHIVIERDGQISVQAPVMMTEDAILQILDQKEYEIHRKLLLWREANQEHMMRQFVSGQSFLYLGRNYNLSVIENQKQGLIFKGGKFILSARAPYPREAFIKFYKKQAKIKIMERVNLYRQQIRHFPEKIQIKEMPTRWGSCTPSGNVYYNWRCIMAPVTVLDYLIIHELVHLEYPDHSREFWQKISTIIPDYEASKEWLRVNGVRLDV